MSIENRLIVVGLKGPSVSGKTTLARDLEAGLRREAEKGGEGLGDVLWVNYLGFALPLYELLSLRLGLKGEHSVDRRLYGAHRIITSLLGSNPLFGAPAYDELIDLVKTICIDMSVDESFDSKNRKFLIDVAALLREYDNDCFLKNMKTLILESYYAATKNSVDEVDESIEWGFPYHLVIVHDIREVAQAKFLKNTYKQCYIVELGLDPEVHAQRLAQSTDSLSPEEILADDHRRAEEGNWEGFIDAKIAPTEDASLYKNMVNWMMSTPVFEQIKKESIKDNG